MPIGQEWNNEELGIEGIGIVNETDAVLTL